MEPGPICAAQAKREKAERRDSEFHSKQTKEVLEPLLERLLRMMEDKDRSSPERDKVHRRLLQRKGMHRIVLRLLGTLPADYTETVGPKCYRALALLCDDAPGIQTELAAHVPFFVEHFDSIPHEVATVLSAVYKDNIDLCYKVEESVISRIVLLLRDDLAAQYLRLAKIIIAPRDQVLLRECRLWGLVFRV